MKENMVDWIEMKVKSQNREQMESDNYEYYQRIKERKKERCNKSVITIFFIFFYCTFFKFMGRIFTFPRFRSKIKKAKQTTPQKIPD